MKNSPLNVAGFVIAMAFAFMMVLAVEARTGRNWWGSLDYSLRMAESRSLQLAERYVLARRRDSIMQDIRSWPDSAIVVRSSGVPRVVIDSLQRRIAATLSLVDPSRVPSQRPARIGIIAIVDTGPRLAGLRRAPGYLPAQYVMPASTDGRTCMVILRINGNELANGSLPRWAISRPTERRSLLGSCTWYYAFGLPGRGMQQWLDNSDYAIARFSDWWVGGKTVMLGRKAQREGFFLTSATAMAILQRSATIEEISCAAGREHDCVKAYGLTSPKGSMALSDDGDWSFERWGFGTRGALNDLFQTVSAGKFASIWQSDEDLDNSFRKVTGHGLLAYLSESTNERIGPIHLGPAVPSRQLFLSFALAFALLGGMCIAARYRELT